MKNITGILAILLMGSSVGFAADTALLDLTSSVSPVALEEAQVPVQDIKPVEVAPQPVKKANIFDQVQVQEKTFKGEEDSALFGDDCSLQLRKGVDEKGNTVLFAKFQKEDEFKLERVLYAGSFCDATPETSLSTHEYPVSEKTPRVAIKFDQKIFKTQGILVPVEYKIIIELGNHYFGSDTLLYRCVGLK